MVNHDNSATKSGATIYMQTGNIKNLSKYSFHPDLLPTVFILFAFLHFTIGVVLGATMAINLSFASVLLPIHAEINPFGWLTMLIYGMTYAILALFAGLKMHYPVFGWLHFLFAELGIILISWTAIDHTQLVLIIGTFCQFMAPLFFMGNILTSVFFSRKQRAQNPLVQATPEAAQRTVELSQTFFIKEFFGRSSQSKQTDRIARRGTDISLMIFIIGMLIAFIDTITGSFNPGSLPPQPVLILVFFGWIAGTVLAVSLHLYPRYARYGVIKRWQASAGQVIWLVGTLMATIGAYGPGMIMDIGLRMLGVSFLWFSSLYLLPMHRAFRGITHTIAFSWFASWVFAFVFGLFLVSGWDPFSPFMLHLLFLGWITTLAYGIGHTFFPLLLQKKPLGPLSLWQVIGSVLGVSLMAVSFFLMQSGMYFALATILLGIGGTTAGTFALIFIISFLVAKTSSPRKIQ